jgi:probable rRNA maturation factor
VSVSFADEQNRPLDEAALIALVERVLAFEGYPDDTEVSINAVTDEAITALKARHLGVDAATDVLSFPIESFTPGRPPQASVDGPPPMLGDIVIAPAYIARQAHEHGVTEIDELFLMVVHGTLHLMGWDHADDDQAEAMEERERQILSQVGVTRR